MNSKNFPRNYPFFKRFEIYSTVKAKISNFKSAQAFYGKTVSDEFYKADASYINLIVVVKEYKRKKIEDKNTTELKYNFDEINIALLRKTESDFAAAKCN
jgi:hypothetical protein